MLHFKTKRRIFLPLLARHLKAQSLRLSTSHTSSRPNLKRIQERTGILTGYPSTTPPYDRGLVLGSPNPRTNNVAEETLDISTWQILTAISLLMPAFSLVVAPASLTAHLLRSHNALLLIRCPALQVQKLKVFKVCKVFFTL